jgi:hypothetical protein
MPRLDANPPLPYFRLFLMRWMMSAALVFGTYNPSGTSYYHWVAASPRLTTAQLFVGIFILCVAVAFVRMAYLSVGYVGTASIVVLLGMAIVLLAGLGLLDFNKVDITTYAIEVWASLTLAIATGWAFIQKRISGERDVLRRPP